MAGATMYVHQRGVVAYQRLWWCSPPAGMVGTCNPMLLPQPPAQQCKAKCRAMSNPSDYAVVLDVGNVFGQAWGTSVDVSTLASTVAPQIFAFSIFPYAGFLYCLTKSSKTPPIALGGFYFLLAFVFATIPAGIYAKQVYGTTLANVDWLHGGAESLLTVTNLLVVLGFRNAIKDAEGGSGSGTSDQGTASSSASQASKPDAVLDETL